MLPDSDDAQNFVAVINSLTGIVDEPRVIPRVGLHCWYHSFIDIAVQAAGFSKLQSDLTQYELIVPVHVTDIKQADSLMVMSVDDHAFYFFVAVDVFGVLIS